MASGTGLGLPPVAWLAGAASTNDRACVPHPCHQATQGREQKGGLYLKKLDGSLCVGMLSLEQLEVAALLAELLHHQGRLLLGLLQLTSGALGLPEPPRVCPNQPGTGVRGLIARQSAPS